MTKQTLDPAARAYAQSLLELADEQSATDAVAADVSAMQDVLEQTPSFAEFLADPGISLQDRKRVIENTFGGKAHSLLMSTLGVLNLKARLRLMPQVLNAFEVLLDERHGKVEVDVTVPRRMSDDQLEQIRQQINAALGKDTVVHQYVDETLIGGIVLRVGDTILDGSVKAQLEAMRERLLTSR